MAEENKDKKQTVAGNAEDTSKIDVNKQEKLKNKVSAEDKEDRSLFGFMHFTQILRVIT